MKARLIVMNGRRILQQQQGETWKDVDVDKAGTLKPGIYNLASAVTPDRTKLHDGIVLHIDRDTIFQYAGKTVLKHARTAFTQPPEVGAMVRIRYERDHARVEALTQTLRQGMKL